MAFWGIEVKPMQSHTHRYGDIMGKLILTQATLGNGSNGKKSILQCEVGHKKPVYLCALLPDKMESCSLNLEFDEEEDVRFSVVGQRSIHLSGFIQGQNPEFGSEDEIFGEDIGESDDSGESSDYSDDSESFDDKNFINDGDMDMFPPSSHNSGVVIEEIVDDEKPANENDKKKHPVKNNQLALKGSADAAVLDSEEEDEDGFPVSSSLDKDQKAEDKAKKNKKKKSETKDDSNELTSLKSLKRKINETSAGKEPQKQSIQQEEPSDATEEGQKKKKKKKEKSVLEDKEQPKETNASAEDESGEKKKKKKKKKAKGESDIVVQNVTASESEPTKSKTKHLTVRNYQNGLIVEEVKMGKPDGKRASSGKKVLVRYIGKLQKNGKIFDSNIGKAPFKFILGIGQVIKGWDVGIEGMRVGDKRKLTIPPAMGYGAEGSGPIPANAWLEFNVELVNVL